MWKHIRTSLVWSTKISILTFFLALIFAVLSSLFSQASNLILSIIVVLIFIVIGIIADTIGMAAATANEKNFHAMAAEKVVGAKKGVYITKNAPVFSSLFNDVMGDIAGIISGAASVTLLVQLMKLFNIDELSIWNLVFSVILTALIAALTVGGKAVCKSIAIYQSTNIILFTGKILHYISLIGKPFTRKKNNTH